MPLVIKRLDSRHFAPEKLQKLNLFATPQFFCDVYCLEPGQSQKPHKHAGSDKLYAVLEGRVQVTVGDEAGGLQSGEVVLCPAGVEHGLANDSEARAAVLVFMAPHPQP